MEKKTMGYETRYELDVIDAKEEIEFYEKKICEMLECDYLFVDPCKWYDHKEDMKKFSIQYPNQIFILSGEGEDAMDIWKKYFQKGKSYTVKIQFQFPEFDKSKLE